MSAEQLIGHKNLKPFKEHGFVPIGETGDQVYGDCIFCGSESHFYINPEKKLWDCKHCGREGGFHTYLQQVVTKCQEDFKGKRAITLAQQRGISARTLREHGVGYSIETNMYIIPVYSMNGDHIQDIRRYKNRRLWSTTLCKTGLFGWEKIEDFTDIWICEGEWDVMAMDELLQELGKKKECAIAVPGAGTFKSEWVSIFRNKSVRAIYDNDDAGRKGAAKLKRMIGSVVTSLNFIHWPETTETGYDLRDLYIEKGTQAYHSLESMLGDTVPGAEDGEESEAGFGSEDLSGPGLSPEEVYTGFRRWLEFPNGDVTALDVMYGSILANRLDGDPLWMFLVAESGGMKSELLSSLSKAAMIYSTSKLTPHSLISGANFTQADPSLIPKLDGKVMVVKDFTTLLGMPEAIKEEVFTILRDAYDGHTQKDFGNGVVRAYESKFGILAGVTPIIEARTEGQVALGERFLMYRLPYVNNLQGQRTVILRAIRNTTKEASMREELHTISDSVLKHDYTVIPSIPERFELPILCLAQWTAMMRAYIIRDKYSKEALYDPFVELGTRLAKQLTKAMIGIAMFHRREEITDYEYRVAMKIARSTVPGRMEKIVRYMYCTKPSAEYSIVELCDTLCLPQLTVSRLIENLYMLKTVRKSRYGGGIKSSWSLTDDTVELISTSKVYEHIKALPTTRRKQTLRSLKKLKRGGTK